MNRLVAIAGLPLWAVALWAQEQIVSTRIFTEPSGAQYFVDGKAYTSPQTFLWPKGSKHVLSFDPIEQTGIRIGARYRFTSWGDSTGQLAASSPTIAVTADPALTWFKATVSLEYEVKVLVTECPQSDALRCDSPGTATVGGAVFDRNGTLWVTANSVLQLAALANPGYVFVGWQLGPGYPDAMVASTTVTGPMSIQPRFEPAKRVTLRTQPPELHVLADRQPLLTPVTMEWGNGTRHVLGAPSPQDDLYGKAWVFDSWEHGGGQNTLYIAERANEPVTLTAKFIPGARVALQTSPSGLKLNVDGRSNWPSYSFVWGVGTRHDISAPEQQTDSSGRRYVLKGWSNGGPAVQQLTVPEGDGVRLTAVYQLLNRITVQSVPPGLPIQADGAECRTPCVLERKNGEQIRVSAPLSIALNDGTRLDFEGWTDGGPADRSWMVEGEARTLTARYRMMHRLAAIVEPEGGARIRFEPVSTDAFYPEGTLVQVAAEPNPGFRFRAWDGDLTGPFRIGTLALAGPRIVRAMLDRVPFVAEAGVRNAAGETPVEGVAAGSIVSILGASLAPAYQVGPTNPLAQTIADVTVRIEGRLLPLVFVSPEQINAQLPMDLEEGRRTLTVRWEGQPEASTTMNVVRNAPGLFAKTVENRPFAAAFHQDGSAINLESPARKGEVVSVFGTGFGPYLRRPPEGFAVPDTPSYPLADAVAVIAGEAVIEPVFCGAAPGQVGTVVTRFRLPDTLPGSSTLELKVRVNEKDSNTVQLPIE